MILSPFVATVLFWIAAVACVVAQAAILRSVLRVMRAASARRAPDAPVSRARPLVELMWALLPAVALVAVLAATWRSLHTRT